jgi:proteasome lid subunit RPN8/RPN11
MKGLKMITRKHNCLAASLGLCRLKCQSRTVAKRNSSKLIKQNKKRKQTSLPVVKIAHVVCKEIMLTIGAQPAETGGIILGPVGTNDVTDFFFDEGGNCTGVTYSPDCVTLRKKMKEQWLPAGIDMKGFVHSHPSSFDCLSGGDLSYINRLLNKNEDMTMFVAPIVIPSQFRLTPLVVLRDKPKIAQEVRFEYF